MMAKLMTISVFLLVVFSVCFALAVVDYPKGQTVYVKVATENFRDAPRGNKIGTLDKATSLVVLEDSPKWVKVRVEGWIWKESLTASKLALKSNQYRALQIVVKDEATAKEIVAQLQAGGDFKKIAKEKSIGPAAKKGGDLGYFQKGDFQPVVEQVILGLKPGEISVPLKSEIGYHIFKRVE